MASLLNKAEVRRRLIEVARNERYYFTTFTPQISSTTLEKIERSVDNEIRNIVSKAPSKGKTL